MTLLGVCGDGSSAVAVVGCDGGVVFVMVVPAVEVITGGGLV